MITKINDEIVRQFNKRKVVPYSAQLDFPEMLNWSEVIGNKYGLEKENFEKYVKEIFWVFTSIELSLGYSFIALSDTQNPSGKKGMALEKNDIPDSKLGDIHFWYHLYNAWESIHRLWERIVSVLMVRLTPSLKTKYYYDGYVNRLKTIDSLSSQSEILDLDKYNKSWNKIASMRNNASHEVSNPCLNFNINADFSPILGKDGEQIIKYNFQFPNLKQEIDTIINSYNKSYKLFVVVKRICESNIRANKEIVS
jgi:hypothetical protein